MNITSIKYGIYGGLAGGVVFGVMMGLMGMLPMIGSMVGIPSAWVGFGVHLAISATIGVTFGVALEATGLRAGVWTGSVYGLAWWVLGPLTLMPLFMGMGLGVNWHMGAMAQAMPSLVGHLIFGSILGATYARLRDRSGTRHVGYGETKAA